jgi:pilus assembly protein CpaE
MDDRTTTKATTVIESGLRVLVAGGEPAALKGIVDALRAAGAAAEVVNHGGGADQVMSAVARTDPDVLVLAMPDAALQALDLVDRVGHDFPSLSCILQCSDHSPEFLLRAMRAGVREVLPGTADADAIVGAVGHIAQKRAPRAQREGRILAFVSCKGGGGGATFLATNLAYALAAVESQKVILIDLNLQWGDATFFLSDRKPVSTLADLAVQIQRLDAEFLASSLVPVHENLGVLAAPQDPLHAMDVKPEHLDVLLRLARANYDFVILDAGRALDAVTVRAFDYADTIYPILQLSLPFIRDGKRVLDAFRALEYPQDKVRLLVNRFEKGSGIALADMEAAVGARVYRTFPNAYDSVSASVNQGVPVIKLANGSAIAKAIREFAHALVPVHAKPQGGWLTRVLGRGNQRTANQE